MSDGPQTPTEVRACLELRNRQIEALRRASAALASDSSFDEMVRDTLTVAVEVLDATDGALLLYDPEKEALVVRCAVGPSADRVAGASMPVGEGTAGQVFRSGSPALVQGPDGVSDTSLTSAPSAVAVPLKRSGNTLLGVLQVQNALIPFDERDVEVLEIIGAQVAVVFQIARLSEEARQAQIVHMLGDISHDIKNMLTPIQTGLQTLQPMLETLFIQLDEIAASCPEAEPWGGKIRAAAAAVTEDYGWIVDNALDSAERVQERTQEIADAVKGELAPPVFRTADLNETVHSVARALRLVAERAGVSLLLDLDPELPAAEFDPKQVYNALYNLVNNAIPETPAGGQVTVRTRGPQTEGECFLLEVEDTGRGMPEYVRARLFTDRAISTKPGGSGLGTRIVAAVVRRHHGTIAVRSEEGRGSTFSVRLPLRVPASPQGEK